ncbi:MAG: hypothetical protein IPN33_22685 [Saprospiraceae bacterium]|nr:hypothetical protein [Saprospiraceae bacterium]
MPLQLRQQIGVGFEDGIDKINIGFLPWLDDNSFQTKNNYIEQQIKVGDAISLMPTHNGGTSIRHNNRIIGMLKTGTIICPPNGLSGYIVTSVLNILTKIVLIMTDEILKLIIPRTGMKIA